MGELTEVGRRARILMGEAYLRLGNRTEAYRIFQILGHTEGMIACGQSALQAGLFSEGQAIYSSANVEPPQELLVFCGSKAFEKGWLDDGQEAYGAANVPMPVEGLKLCGEKALEEGRRMTAVEAFHLAATLELGLPMP